MAVLPVVLRSLASRRVVSPAPFRLVQFSSFTSGSRWRPEHPKAALVFAATAMELGIKVVLLKPIVFGLVHTEAMASLITELTIQHSGMERFYKLLSGILKRFSAVDLETYKRTGSTRTLWKEITEVRDARNGIIHRGENVEESTAELAVAVAQSLLYDIFPQVIGKLVQLSQ